MSSDPINPLASASIHGRNDALLTDKSILQSLNGGSDTHNRKQYDNVDLYVHPLVKKSSAKLSDRSLEMCTESLGSETGSGEIMEDTMIGSYSSMVHSKERKIGAKAKSGGCNFPPPLSSINHSVTMKFHRENGRLVMDAVVLMESSNSSLFLAERINGRLTLQLKKGDSEEIEEAEFEFDETNRGDTGDSVSGDKGMSENTENNRGNIGIEQIFQRFEDARQRNEAYLE